MGEATMLANAIRFIGLWRIFINGGNALYYLIAQQLAHGTAAGPQVWMDIQALIFDLVLSTAVIVAAPAVAQMIVGTKAPRTEGD
ncbi:MAG TPA: hypothetical protein VIG39_05045 [Rhizomicrobium sp.]